MIYNYENVKKIDKILKLAEERRIVDTNTLPGWTKDDTILFNSFIKESGYGKILTKGVYVINDFGLSFIKTSSMEQEYNKRLKEEKAKDAQALLTQKQIAAAKREPYLITWSIITTLTSLILAILQFIK
jgi:hypothetical protein